jgi:hypothetical protein
MRGATRHDRSESHGGVPVGGRQADSSARPLLRRRARIRRPARVRIRMRKPWVFFLLRLLGWNVRFT